MFAAAMGWIGTLRHHRCLRDAEPRQRNAASIRYGVLNMLGGLLGATGSAAYGARPSVVSNLVWAGVALHSIVATGLARRALAAAAVEPVMDGHAAGLRAGGVRRAPALARHVEDAGRPERCLNGLRIRGYGARMTAVDESQAATALVESVDRALTILEHLARDGEAGVTEIAHELGVHKSTAFRLLATLESHRLVEQDGDRGRYRLGVGNLRLAGATTARLDLVTEARRSVGSWRPTRGRPSTSRCGPRPARSTSTRSPGLRRCSRTTGSASTSRCTRRATARCC